MGRFFYDSQLILITIFGIIQTCDRITIVVMQNDYIDASSCKRKIMIASTIVKSAAAATVRRSQIRGSMAVRCAAWFAVLMFTNLPVLAFAQPPCPGIHVKILNIRNSTET
jgi:hypothetical protein